MNKKTTLLPRAKKALSTLGQNIKLARLRRKLSASQVAERADISRSTLWAIEKGAASVTIGAYMQVAFVLGLEADFARVAKDDVLGQKLQDAALTIKKRAPKKARSSDEN